MRQYFCFSKRKGSLSELEKEIPEQFLTLPGRRFLPLRVIRLIGTTQKTSESTEVCEVHSLKKWLLDTYVVNGHIKGTYSKVTGNWTPLELVCDSSNRIHCLARGLNEEFSQG